MRAPVRGFFLIITVILGFAYFYTKNSARRSARTVAADVPHHESVLYVHSVLVRFPDLTWMLL